MTAPEIVLDEAQVDLLFAVKARRVSFARGVYRRYAGGCQQDVSLGVQVLRAMKLVRLVDLAVHSRIPPTRETELTEQGERVAAAYA